MSLTEQRITYVWDLRVPTADQLLSYMEPTLMAFGEEASGPDVEDWAKLLEADRWLGVFERPESELAVGGAAALTVRLTVPGGEVPAAAVTAVGVRPDFRRRGILRALMRRQLDDVRMHGEPIAVLWASEGAIYQQFGYGFAAVDGTFEVATARTAFSRQVGPEGHVRVVTEEESASLIPRVYDVMRATTPGAISRSDVWWTTGVLSDPEYSRRGAGPKFRIVYEADGVPEGYAIYRLKSDWDHRGPHGLLEVREAVCLTPRAWRGVWRYLFDVDLVRTVKAYHVAVPNPLQHLLAEPRALGLVGSDGLWVRLVDVPAALGARRYGTGDDLVLEISDAFCEWNAGRWRLRSGDGKAATVERTEDAPDILLDTTDLAAIYLGGTRAADLAAVGRIEERTAGAIVRLDVLFAADRAPWCVSMF